METALRGDAHVDGVTDRHITVQDEKTKKYLRAKEEVGASGEWVCSVNCIAPCIIPLNYASIVSALRGHPARHAVRILKNSVSFFNPQKPGLWLLVHPLCVYPLLCDQNIFAECDLCRHGAGCYSSTEEYCSPKFGWPFLHSVQVASASLKEEAGGRTLYQQGPLTNQIAHRLVPQ